MCRTRPISRHDDRAGPLKDDRRARASSRLFGDKITTDHISPAGSIRAASPAGPYLLEHQVSAENFNQYGPAAATMKS